VTTAPFTPGAIAERGTILRCQVGSGLHGTAIAGTDDRDEMGICIEPPSHVIGLQQFEHWVFRTAWERTGTSLRSAQQPTSGPGDLDLIVYSLRKWMKLALGGNPTVLLPLFAPENELVTITDLGRELRTLAPSIISRVAAKSFGGYATAQRERLLGQRGQKGTNRPDGPNGYDGKYAMHMLRLGFQGIELLETGHVTLPVPEPTLTLLRHVRVGDAALRDVLGQAEENERRLVELATTSPVAEKPDIAVVDAWLISAHQRHWAEPASV
jgi:uncharacterized protein